MYLSHLYSARWQILFQISLLAREIDTSNFCSVVFSASLLAPPKLTACSGVKEIQIKRNSLNICELGLRSMFMRTACVPIFIRAWGGGGKYISGGGDPIVFCDSVRAFSWKTQLMEESWYWGGCLMSISLKPSSYYLDKRQVQAHLGSTIRIITFVQVFLSFSLLFPADVWGQMEKVTAAAAAGKSNHYRLWHSTLCPESKYYVATIM